MAFKSISGKKALPNGSKVNYDLTNVNGLSGLGKIIGISGELPIVGFLYILETDNEISETYPYPSFVCPEIYLEKA